MTVYVLWCQSGRVSRGSDQTAPSAPYQGGWYRPTLWPDGVTGFRPLPGLFLDGLERERGEMCVCVCVWHDVLEHITRILVTEEWSLFTVVSSLSPVSSLACCSVCHYYWRCPSFLLLTASPPPFSSLCVRVTCSLMRSEQGLGGSNAFPDDKLCGFNVPCCHLYSHLSM